MNKVCAVFGGGDPVSAAVVRKEFSGGELLIAADSGYLLMHSLGLEPDLILGDFDSAPEPDFADKQVYPKQKDDTDLMLALKEGLSRGCDRFLIFWATGGRLDHTYAAVQSLAYLLEQGASGVIVSDTERIELLAPGSYTLPAMKGYTLSLFAYTDSVGGLTVTGAEYTCEGITLRNSFPLGVSNSAEDSPAKVCFSKGIILVIRSKL